ncbi:MAG: STN domain-containing protein [Opitutaceae bacterium]|nr:STN domain-containing protein [Opitutaceae bacterium]
MPYLPPHPILTHCRFLFCLICVILSTAATLRSEANDVGDTTRRIFDVPAGEAHIALKQFAQQAGLELLYSAREIAGAKTNAVKGELTARDALKRLLSGTSLIAMPGKSRGAVAVTRAPDPNGSRAAPTEIGRRPQTNHLQP